MKSSSIGDALEGKRIENKNRKTESREIVFIDNYQVEKVNAN